MRVRDSLLALMLASASGGQVMAQAAMTPAERAEVQKQIEELRATRKDLDRQMSNFDQRIEQLESRLTGEAPATQAVPVVAAPAAASVATAPGQPPVATAGDASGQVGKLVLGKGFVLAASELGELDWSAFTYARYLNQLSLNESYTDAFGRTFAVKNREDVQFQKVALNFKGWLLDQRFTYLFYVWTPERRAGRSGAGGRGRQPQLEIRRRPDPVCRHRRIAHHPHHHVHLSQLAA